MFDILQLIGGIILSFGYIPQIIQIIKTKSVEDLNLKTFLSIFIGILFMEIYAINLVVNAVGHMFLITNTMALILSGIMCILILKYKRRNNENIKGENNENIKGENMINKDVFSIWLKVNRSEIEEFMKIEFPTFLPWKIEWEYYGLKIPYVRLTDEQKWLLYEFERMCKDSDLGKKSREYEAFDMRYKTICLDGYNTTAWLVLDE